MIKVIILITLILIVRRQTHNQIKPNLTFNYTFPIDYNTYCVRLSKTQKSISLPACIQKKLLGTKCNHNEGHFLPKIINFKIVNRYNRKLWPFKSYHDNSIVSYPETYERTILRYMRYLVFKIWSIFVQLKQNWPYLKN